MNRNNLWCPPSDRARGYMAARQAIVEDGGTIEAARHHRGVACGDLRADDFTRGWKLACDVFEQTTLEASRRSQMPARPASRR